MKEKQLRELFPELEVASKASLKEQIEKVGEEFRDLERGFEVGDFKNMLEESFDVAQAVIGVIYKLEKVCNIKISDEHSIHIKKISSRYKCVTKK